MGILTVSKLWVRHQEHDMTYQHCRKQHVKESFNYALVLPAVLMEHAIRLWKCNITCVAQNTSYMTVSFLHLYITNHAVQEAFSYK